MLEFPMRGVPYLKAAAVHSRDQGTLSLFLLNRSLDQAMTVSIEASGFDSLTPQQATTLRHDDLEAINTRDAISVSPVPLDGVVVTEGGGVRVTLPAASWNVVQIGTNRSG
jgi:alpha-N-arabinofuranosidase